MERGEQDLTNSLRCICINDLQDTSHRKPWKPGERILPHNFASGRDYRGGNALYLAMHALERGYADPRWGGYRQIQETGGHVRKGEKGTPIMYVDFRQRRTARDEQGNPVPDEEGRPKLEWVQRDRPIVKLHHVFNVEQTEGLQLRSLQTAAPEWEGHERAEALITSSGVRLDHEAGDRAYYSLKDDRVVLPERSQFPSQDAYTHTALHELGHATAYVSSWITALENNPKEIRAAAVDAQRISDSLLARERERSLGDERAEHQRPAGGAGGTPEREPERSPRAVPEVGDAPQPAHGAALRDLSRSAQVINPAAVGDRQRDTGPSR